MSDQQEKEPRFKDFVRFFETNAKLSPYAANLRQVMSQSSDEMTQCSDLLLPWAKKVLGDHYLEVLAEGYARFVSDVNFSQLKYERSGHYLNTKYSEVFDRAYNNPDFMAYYHWGVFASTFCWQHHLEIFQFFARRFIGRHLATEESGRLIDLGSGSGLWTFLSLSKAPGWTADGIDISTTSAGLATKMTRSIGMDGRAVFHCDDATTWKSNNGLFDAGVSFFLLEHLEEPQKLLQNLSDNLKPRGWAFVTGALTAAEVDHIKEFIKESELVEMAEKAGFRVVETLSASPKTHPSGARFLPRSMAMTLQKRANDIW